DDLREAAAGVLRGIDARTVKTIEFQPTDLVFDQSGRRLLQAKIIPPDGRNPQVREEVQVWDSATDEQHTLPQRTRDFPGAITFLADGTPVQIVWSKDDRNAVTLWDMANQKPARRYEWPKDVVGEPAASTITPGGAFAGVLARAPDQHRSQV